MTWSPKRMPMSSPAAAFFSQAVRLLRALVGDSVVIKTIIRRCGVNARDEIHSATQLIVIFSRVRVELMARESSLVIFIQSSSESIQTRTRKFRAGPRVMRSVWGGGFLSTLAWAFAVSVRRVNTCWGSTLEAILTGISIRRSQLERVQLVTGFEIRLPFGTINSEPFVRRMTLARMPMR